MPTPIRLAEPADLDQIVQLRMRLFDDATEMNGVGPDEAILNVTVDYFRQSFDKDDCKTWVAFVDQHVVAVGSLAVFCRPPYPGNLAGKDAYLLNMYTLPEYRRRGYAQAILKEAMQYAQQQGFGKIWLHATADGQPVYAGAGFAPSADYMEWSVH